MKTWLVIRTEKDGSGQGKEFQLRWQAEQAYDNANRPGVIVTMSEFTNGRQTEIVRDNRFSVEREKQA